MLTAPATRTSRTVVIGLGNFGLRVVSLLLPRMETHYRFGTPESQNVRILARCGLVGRRPGEPVACLALERPILENAFVHARAIQRAVLLQEAGRSEAITEQVRGYLDIKTGWSSSVTPASWVKDLARPILADAWNYTDSFVHLNAYLIASVSEDVQDLIASLALAIATLQAPVTLNVILNVDVNAQRPTTNGQSAQAKITAIEQHLDRLSLRRRIYLVGQSKVNRALTQFPGEIELTVCNFLDTFIFTALGDMLAENALEDQVGMLNQAPFCLLGAAKRYIPIIEAFDQIVDDTVSEVLREHLGSDIATIGSAAPFVPLHSEFDPQAVYAAALHDLPVMIDQPPGWRHRMRARIPRWRMRAPHTLAHELSELAQELPHLEFDRSYWRAALRKRRWPLPVKEWWPALVEYQNQLEQQIQLWSNSVSDRLGVELTPQQGQPSHGLLPEQEEHLRGELATLLATSPAGLGAAIGYLRQLKQRYARTQQALDGWNKQAQMMPPATSGQAAHKAQLRQQLVDILRARSYPAAVLMRVSMFWLIPLFLMTASLTQGGSAPPIIQAHPQAAVIVWTTLWIAIYVLIQFTSVARVELAKRRIESLVFADLAKDIECHLYSKITQSGSPGPLAAYLGALDHRLFAPNPNSSGQDSSLLALLEQTAQQLLHHGSAQPGGTSPTECVVYKSVGDQATRRVLEAYVAAELQNAPAAWELSQTRVRQYLSSASSLTEYIRESLHETILRRYLSAVRAQDALRLHNILRLPEQREQYAGEIVDDLKLRAKPLLGLTQQSHKLSTAMLSLDFVTAEPEALEVLLSGKQRLGHQNQYAVPSCDRFGASYVTIVLGISTRPNLQTAGGGTNP
jgi:hypothetical protein